jgi:hypothetical protein
MNRTKKLGLLAAVLVLLILGTLIATNLEADTAAEETDTAVTVFSLDSDTVTALSWTAGDETLAFTYDGESWNYDADSAFPVSADMLDSMVAVLSTVTAEKTIDEPESLSEYGLLEPACTITVSAEDETTLRIGDETELGSYRYLSIGDGSVYLVDDTILDSFSYGLLDVAQLEEIPAMDTIETFTLETQDHSWTLEYLEDSGLAYSDSYVWFLNQDGGYTTLDTDLTEAFIGNITGMTWLECVDYQGGSNLDVYGLDSPAATLSIDYTASTTTTETDEDGNTVYSTQETPDTFQLELGGTCDSGCYARITGSDMIYVVDSAILDAMEYTTLEELLPDEILLLDEDALLSVDVTLDGTTYTITREIREVETESEDSSEEPEVTEEIAYTVDGEDVSFDSILSQLEALSASGAVTGAEAGLDEIAFVFHMDSADYPEIALTFHRYNSTDCLVTLNGETRLLVDRATLMDLVEQFQVMILS